MNETEIQELINQLKAQGLDDDKIMNVFWEAFTSGEMDREDLETLANAMGYELSEDFKNDENPDPIATKGAEGLDKEDLEDAKALDEEEDEEEFKEKIDEMNEDSDLDEALDEEEDSDSDDSEDSEDSEDEEWEKAQKMFKI